MSKQPPAFSATSLYKTPILENGQMHWGWVKQFQIASTQLNAPVATTAAPTSSASAATFGQIATDGTYLYIATGNNQWKRIPLTSF